MRMLTLLTLALLMCAACGGTTDTISNIPVLSSAPTLDQTFTSGDGEFAFDYPSTWVIRESSGQVFVGTNAEALQDTASDATAVPGQFVLAIIIVPVSRVEGLNANASPREMLAAFGPFLTGASESAGDANQPVFSDPTDLTIGSRRAARMDGTAGQNQTLLIALEVEPGVFAVLAGGSASGELASFEPTALAIAESIRYSSSGDVEELDAATPEVSG